MDKSGETGDGAATEAATRDGLAAGTAVADGPRSALEVASREGAPGAGDAFEVGSAPAGIATNSAVGRITLLMMLAASGHACCPRLPAMVFESPSLAMDRAVSWTTGFSFALTFTFAPDVFAPGVALDAVFGVALDVD